MILLLEEDTGIRKKLSDMLHKERIIGVSSGVQIFEMVCKYKQDINTIVSSVSLLDEIISHKTLVKLCQKLAIEVPPILCFYGKPAEQAKTAYEKDYKQIMFIEFSEEDEKFPDKFINAIKRMYPELNADIIRAKESWQKIPEPENHANTRKWLRDHGFFPDETSETKTQKQKEQHRAFTQDNKEMNYCELYLALKRKYDDLLALVSSLIASVDDDEPGRH